MLARFVLQGIFPDATEAARRYYDAFETGYMHNLPFADVAEKAACAAIERAGIYSGGTRQPITAERPASGEYALELRKRRRPHGVPHRVALTIAVG